MPFPFPGMDPYLEQEVVWHDFQLRAILDRVYDESGYPFYLYQRETDPPLAGDDAASARTLLSRNLEGR